jgi:proline iminopeptidase
MGRPISPLARRLLLAPAACVGACVPAASPPPASGAGGAAGGAAQGLVAVEGASLPYVVTGAGRPCVVYGSGTYYRRTFSRAFDATLRCVHLDERGFVAGAGRPGGRPFGIGEAVADLEAARRQLGLDRFVLVGHSVHGLVALAYAARHPQHVTHVVAIGAPPELPPAADASRAYRSANFTTGRQAQHERNRARLDSLRAAHPGRPVVSTYVANGALYWADSTFDSTPLWRDVVFSDTTFADLQGDRFAWDPAAPAVDVPVFVALGRHDYVVPPTLWDPATRPRVPFRRVTVASFDRAGHTAQLEDQAEFDRRLLAWLADTR